MNLTFRKAILDDAENINILVNSVYRGDSSKNGWTTEAELLDGQRIDVDRVRELIEKKDNVILVMLDSESLVGCVHLEKTESGCYLGMLSVDSTKQGGGHGRKLMEYAESFAASDLLCNEMHMTVIGQRTELISYYERRGYKLTGERKAFPMDDPRFGIPKRTDLYFVVMRKSL